MNRAILHIDMDAFFASVEIRERPELAARPVMVGGSAEGRGVVAAANYVARGFGIHSAMPTATAQRLCPALVVLRPRLDLYAQVARQIREIFHRYTPQVEPLSLDEAYLDVTDSLRLFGSAESIGCAIKEAIKSELGLVASVGVAPNKFLAKIASDIDKPDGFVVVNAETAADFLAPLPITRLWGIGKVGARRFETLGIRTIGQLRHYSVRLLERHFGHHAAALLGMAWGEDERPVVPDHEAKSISHETTFARDVDDRQVLHSVLYSLAEQVGRRLRRHGLLGQQLFIKVRLADFTTLSRSRSLPEPTHTTAEIAALGRELLERVLDTGNQPLRLIGIGLSRLMVEGGEPRQASLFDTPGKAQQRDLDRLADAVCERFGSQAIRRGKQRAKP